MTQNTGSMQYLQALCRETEDLVGILAIGGDTALALLLLRNLALIQKYPAKMRAKTGGDALVAGVVKAITADGGKAITAVAAEVDHAYTLEGVYRRAVVGYDDEVDTPKPDYVTYHAVCLAAAATFFPEKERREAEAVVAEILSVVASDPVKFEGAWQYVTHTAKYSPLADVSPLLKTVVEEARVRA